MTTAPDPYTLPDVSDITVSVLGGTGEQGRGLAKRLAAAGQRVIIGSRSSERAEEIAAGLSGDVRGATNAQAAREGEIVIIAVPWDGHRELLESLAEELSGRIVVDCVNPLASTSRGRSPSTSPEGSAAQQAAQVLPDSRVVAAFHHISAVLLLDDEVDSIDTDVLVLG